MRPDNVVLYLRSPRHQPSLLCFTRPPKSSFLQLWCDTDNTDIRICKSIYKNSPPLFPTLPGPQSRPFKCDGIMASLISDEANQSIKFGLIKYMFTKEIYIWTRHNAPNCIMFSFESHTDFTISYRLYSGRS